MNYNALQLTLPFTEILTLEAGKVTDLTQFNKFTTKSILLSVCCLCLNNTTAESVQCIPRDGNTNRLTH